MKAAIKKIIKLLLLKFVEIIRNTRGGRYLFHQIVNSAMDNVTTVSHEGVVFKFPAPNLLCLFRVETFSTKEPETLEWIDKIPKGSILWDVGANVGLYSVYAAKKRNCRVWAFEPSVFNLELLARGVFLNDVTEKVCIVPFALSNKLESSELHMTTTEWGGACSTFGKDYGYDGKKLNEIFKFRTVGMTMVDAVEKMAIPQPDYIKMDVDGIEHLILKAGAEVLREVKGILVEVNDDFKELSDECQVVLSDAGMVLRHKLHSEMFDNSLAYGRLYNQIWVRP